MCPIGTHVDHQHGLVTGFAIDTYYEAYEKYDVPGDCGEGGLPERSAGQERERELPREESGPVIEELSCFTPADPQDLD